MGESFSREEKTVSEPAVLTYDVERAYDTVQALFEGDADTVETFIQPVKDVDQDMYTGDEPIQDFDQQFRDALFEKYNPDKTREEHGREVPEHGYHLAEDFLTADTYEEAKNALEGVETLTRDMVKNKEAGANVVIGDTELSNEQYADAVVFHIVRRLIQRRHNYLFSSRKELYP